MNKSSATLPKAIPPVQVERKPPAPLPPQQRNGNLSCDDSSDSTSGDSSLEGNVKLSVELPDGRNVVVSVERRMPVMDLLIQIATSYKLSPSNHQINVFNGQDCVTYMANTPIGSLNASKVQVIPRRSNVDVLSKKLPKANQPFEQTFRLQVHLPRQQLLVVRVSPKTRLEEIFNIVCQQKDLDKSRYALQHPTAPEIQLDWSRSLDDYNLTEINIISKRNSTAIPSRSSVGKYNMECGPDLEEKKRKRIFGFMFRKSKSSIGDSSSDESSNQAGSPARNNSDFRVSTSSLQSTSAPSRPTKRAAPKPPSKPTAQNGRPPPPPPLHTKTTMKNQTSEPQTHSRHSSDSSGYHESSVLGDSECIETEAVAKVPVSNLTSTSSSSTTSIMSKKKRAPAPPPPPPLVSKSSVAVVEDESNEKELQLHGSLTEQEEVVTQSCEPLPNTSSCEISTPAESKDDLDERETSNSDWPLDDNDVEKIIPASGETIADEPAPEPIPEPQIHECHTPSFSGLTNYSQNISAHPHEVEHNTTLNLHFDISGDKYREENSGCCSRSDTHTTSDSAVADLDLDASGSTSWSPIPDVKTVGYPREAFMTGMIHSNGNDEIKYSHMENGSPSQEKMENEIEDVRQDSGREEDSPFDDVSNSRGKYDWGSCDPVGSNFKNNNGDIDDNHDEWIKSSSEDEQDVTNACSPTSMCSIDDMTASFEQVIADAENAIKEAEEKFLQDAQENSLPKTLMEENEDSEIDKGQTVEEKIDKVEDNYVLPKKVAKVPINRAPLINFSITTYRARSDSDPSKNLSHSESFQEKSSTPSISNSASQHEKRVTVRSSSFHEKNSSDSIQFKLAPYKSTETNDDIVNFEEEKAVTSARPIKSSIKEKSVSMMNLSNEENFQLKRTISEQQITVTEDGGSPPVESAEYVRLQQEYLKLQEQLMHWQQQLITNQTLLQQQRIVPANLFPITQEMFVSANSKTNIGRTTSTTNLVKEKTNLPASKSQNDLSVKDEEKFEVTRHKSAVILASPEPEISQPSQTIPAKIFPVIAPKPSSPVIRVESMKKIFPRSISADATVSEVSNNKEVDSSSSLPSVRDRINLLLANKRKSAPPLNGSTEGKQNVKPEVVTRKERVVVVSGKETTESGKNFERGGTSRKPVKPISFSVGNYSDTVQERTENSKFRRQRISPGCVVDKETDEPDGEPIKQNGSVNVVIPNQRKPRSNRPLIFTYFGDQINERENKTVDRPVPSAASKVARNEVLNQPNIPLGLISAGKKEVKVDKKPSKENFSSQKIVKQEKGGKNTAKFNTQTNPRDTLMSAIREFGGRNQLRKVPKSESRWNSWHGEVA